MTEVRLNFINNSDDEKNSQVVIFQKNVAADSNELAVAWRVIQNCGQGDSHPFVFPMRMEVSVSDSLGNFTPKLATQDGQRFEMRPSAAGSQLAPSATPFPDSTEVQLRNSLSMGAINANIYKNGELLAVETAVAPGQEAAFQFKPTLWIGVASQAEPGQAMDAALLSQLNTELSLQSIASADIVMTGDGSSAQPFSFRLENVVKG
jgi:hypothetical protein